MKTLLTHEDIEDLLVNVLDCGKVKSWKNDKIACCCPIHGESNPSFAVMANYSPDGMKVIQSFNCLACGAHGSIPKLLMLALPDKFKSYGHAVYFLEHRYGLTYQKTYKMPNGKSFHVRRYGEKNDANYEKESIPMVTLAPFKSGKSTFKYFFSRGFSREDMKEYMIGRDKESMTVTIPVFWEDHSLAGVIGRYVSKNRAHNERYKIYGNFKRSKVLFPLDKVEVVDSTLVLVESQFDAMMMRKWGVKNVLATMGGTLSQAQADIVCRLCSKVILLFDSDKGGDNARKRAKEILRGRVRILPVILPDMESSKDPSEWGKEETLKCLKSAGKFTIRRL